MGQLNEFIARAANKEAMAKGRFWESRFKCQALLDEWAIVACMVYVDLNPIRAGIAATPEGSEFTSIQERIQAWQKNKSEAASISTQRSNKVISCSYDKESLVPENAVGKANPIAQSIPKADNPLDGAPTSPSWLCPISSELNRRGIARMTATEYFDLVDKSGRMTRPDKRGTIDADLVPILLRIGTNPQSWFETISRFGSNFFLAAGLLPNLRNFAHRLGKKWIRGISSARMAFALSTP